MQLQNNYYYFKSALTSKQCNDIINYGKNKLKTDKQIGLDTSGTTFGNNHKQSNINSKPQNDKTVEQLINETKIKKKDIYKKKYIRDSQVTFFNDQWIYDLVYPYLIKANEESGWKYDFDFSESFQFTVYQPDGFYGWHSDGGSDNFSIYKKYIPGVSPVDANGKMLRGYTDNQNMVGKIRKLSMTINLSDEEEYEGGNLKFDFGPHSTENRFVECKEIRPKGSIVVFPSFIYHQVTPIKKGVRYSLVLWSLGLPFK